MKRGISGIKASVRIVEVYGNLLGPKEQSIMNKCPCGEF